MTRSANQHEINTIVASIKGTKKYRETYEGTIRRLVEAELGRRRTRKQVVKAVRKRLHEIVAPYVGDPDYDAAEETLRAVFGSGDEGAVRDACAHILATHASTRERLAIADAFYEQVFSVTGTPSAILDVACALNPLMLPWMGLPAGAAYHAYDLHERRVAFINTYLSLQGLAPLARVQDVAFEPPREQADVALFLKELPRFERNYEGGGLALLEALRARWLVVSFPTTSLHGGRSLVERYRAFLADLIAGTGWQATELLFENELAYCVDKAVR